METTLRKRLGLALFCVVAVAASACSGDSTDDVAAETTLQPAITETTIRTPSETIEVPFTVLDSAIPTNQFTCKTAITHFEVSFVDETGESTVVEARTETDYKTTTTNATCANVVAAADGEPAVLYAVVLDAPAAETYQSIGLSYPGDEFDTVFELVTRAEAEAGLYVEFSDDDGHRVIEPSEVDALELAA